jgi:hypothetical protein
MNTNPDPRVLAIIPDGLKCRKCGVAVTDNFIATWKNGERVEGTEQCQACENEDRLSGYAKSRVLTSALVCEAGLECWEYADGHTDVRPAQEWLDIYDATKKIQEMVKRFDQEVWLPDLENPDSDKGLASIVRPSRRKGMSSDCTGLEGLGITKFMTYCMAGRCAIQLNDPDGNFIQMITAEDENAHRMGLNTIHATAGDALKLINNAIQAWKAGALEHTDDTDVGLG